MPTQKKKSATPHGKIPRKKIGAIMSRNWWVGVIAQMNQKKNSKNERKHKGLNKLCKKTIKIKTNKSKLKETKSKNIFSKSKASKTKTLKKKKVLLITITILGHNFFNLVYAHFFNA